MFSRIYRYLSIIIISLLIGACKVTSTSEIGLKNDNKVDVKLSGSKDVGVQLNN